MALLLQIANLQIWYLQTIIGCVYIVFHSAAKGVITKMIPYEDEHGNITTKAIESGMISSTTHWLYINILCCIQLQKQLLQKWHHMKTNTVTSLPRPSKLVCYLHWIVVYIVCMACLIWVEGVDGNGDYMTFSVLLHVLGLLRDCIHFISWHRHLSCSMCYIDMYIFCYLLFSFFFQLKKKRKYDHIRRR